MIIFSAVDGWHYLFSIPLSLVCIFLILLILVQRGRGGGLTGALGGMGGQSAFGTKAGDVFTRITIGAAIVWILLSMISLKVLSSRAQTAGFDPNQRTSSAPLSPADGKSTSPSGKAPVGNAQGKEAPAATTSPAAPAAAPSASTTAPTSESTK